MVLAILSGPISFAALFAFVALAGLTEFYRLVKRGNVSPNVSLGLLLGTLLLMYEFGNKLFGINFPGPVAIIGAILLSSSLLMAELARDKKFPMTNIALTFFGVGYVVMPFVFLAAIASDGIHPYNAARVLSVEALFWANDVGAYIVGRSFGRFKLAERISPNKTWEGFVGGALIAICFGYLCAFYFGAFTIEQGLVCGALSAIFGTFGDLIESALKRSVNVKDSGSLLPGHGGILDRFDSQLFAFPILYLYLNILSAP